MRITLYTKEIDRTLHLLSYGLFQIFGDIEVVRNPWDGNIIFSFHGVESLPFGIYKNEDEQYLILLPHPMYYNFPLDILRAFYQRVMRWLVYGEGDKHLYPVKRKTSRPLWVVSPEPLPRTHWASTEDLERFLSSSTFLYLDLETEGVDIHRYPEGFRILTLAIANEKGEVLLVKWSGEVACLLKKYAPEKTLVAHNILFERRALETFGIHFRGYQDTAYLLHLLGLPIHLKTLLFLLFQIPDFSVAFPFPFTSKKFSWEDIDGEALRLYMFYDVAFLKRLQEWALSHLPQEIKEHHPFDVSLYMAYEIDKAGLPFDEQAFKEQEERWRNKEESLKKILREEYQMENPASPKQVLEALIRLGLDLQKLPKTEKGAPSTKDEALLKIKPKVSKEIQRFIDVLLEYRKAFKIRNTYLSGDWLGSYRGIEDGRIHTHINPYGTETGRWCFLHTEPIPKRVRTLDDQERLSYEIPFVSMEPVSLFEIQVEDEDPVVLTGDHQVLLKDGIYRVDQIKSGAETPEGKKVKVKYLGRHKEVWLKEVSVL